MRKVSKDAAKPQVRNWIRLLNRIRSGDGEASVDRTGLPTADEVCEVWNALGSDCLEEMAPFGPHLEVMRDTLKEKVRDLQYRLGSSGGGERLRLKKENLKLLRRYSGVKAVCRALARSAHQAAERQFGELSDEQLIDRAFHLMREMAGRLRDR